MLFLNRSKRPKDLSLDKPNTSKIGPNIETNPIFRIPQFSKDKFPNLEKEISLTIIEKIADSLSKLRLKGDSNSSKIELIQEAAGTESVNKMDSRYSTRKNYYPRPSFPDTQFEENVFLSTASHSGGDITEWNIDGLAEHQIYNKLHEMGITITTYKLKNSSDKQAANLIIAGFTGMLKHWWDN